MPHSGPSGYIDPIIGSQVPHGVLYLAFLPQHAPQKLMQLPRPPGHHALYVLEFDFAFRKFLCRQSSKTAKPNIENLDDCHQADGDRNALTHC